MKVPVYDVNGKSKSEVSLPEQFSQPVRADLIKRAVLAELSWQRQAYGADPLAGKRTSAHYHGRRGIRGSMMNREIARMRRIHNSGFLHWRARFVPQATKGRKAHPPKAERNFEQKINRREWLKALFSALSATKDKDLVGGRGHAVNGVKHLPIVVDDKLISVKRTKEVEKLFYALGLGKEIERCSETKTRAGKGTMRNRKTIRRKGPLIIIPSGKANKASENIMGVEVLCTSDLTVNALAPGTTPGRLCVWTTGALEELATKGQ